MDYWLDLSASFFDQLLHVSSAQGSVPQICISQVLQGLDPSVDIAVGRLFDLSFLSLPDFQFDTLFGDTLFKQLDSRDRVPKALGIVKLEGIVILDHCALIWCDHAPSRVHKLRLA